MGRIVQFQTERSVRRRACETRNGEAHGEVVLFTGVRYERWDGREQQGRCSGHATSGGVALDQRDWLDLPE